MYNPELYSSRDSSKAFELIDRYPFATVISSNGCKPFISHLPLTPQKQDGQIELIGHLARANPHWKLLQSADTTVVFHGAHAYITPQWYENNDVPTWNYSTVHVTGPVTLIEDYEGIANCLRLLTAHVERLWPSGWNFSIPDDLIGEGLSKSIVGFKLTVESINHKKKLSQNRSPADRAGIMMGLESRSDNSSQQVKMEMLKLFSRNGDLR